MKTKVTNLLLVALIAFGATACKNDKQNKTDAVDAVEVEKSADDGSSYTVDTDASTVEWQGEKPTGTHTGNVAIASGTFKTDADNMLKNGDFTMDMTSITVTDLEEGDGKEDLEGHLRGTTEGKEGDFFDTTKYPTAKFEVTGMKESDGKNWMEGNLTIKETTKNIKFPVNISMDGDKIILQSETFSIDRTKWDVNFGSKSVFDDLGDKFINDDMEITVYVEANKM